MERIYYQRLLLPNLSIKIIKASRKLVMQMGGVKLRNRKPRRILGRIIKVGSICVMNTIKIIIVLPLDQVIYITLHGTGIVFVIQTLSVAIDMAFYHAFVPYALPQINE